MFLCHTRSPLPAVKEKPLQIVQEKLKTFNVGQAFGTSYLAGNLRHPCGCEPDCEFPC